MSLRLKLLLLGLATLVLPWAGCRYAREMESALRQGEVESLTGLSQTIATSLQGRTDLLYREPPRAAQVAEAHAEGDDARPTEVPEPVDPDFYKPTPYDLEPLALSAAPLLDGYADDWPRVPEAWAHFDKDEHHRFAILTGVHERMLYVVLEVHDEHPVFDAPGAGSNLLDPNTFGDRVWLGFEDNQDNQQQVFLAAAGAGAVTARRIVSGEYGRQSVHLEPRIRGAWQPTADGYRIEVRVPLSMVGKGFGVLVDDRDSRGALPVSYGTLRADDLHTIGHLILAAPELNTYLAQFLQPGLKLSVATPANRVLARVDALATPTGLGPESPVLARLYRRFIDRSNERQPLQSVSPIYDRDHAVEIGKLEVTQSAERWIRLRDRALTHMLNFTLATSAIVITAILVFAAWLALRLSRLRRASETALTRSGLVTAFPETQARDELGDVARSFSTLLSRLNEYTSYLRTLAGKLAHEIRTPLTIVRSSLDNLESEQVTPAARAYLERARQGSERLNGILVAMGAATRVEEAIGSAERVSFDLVPVLASAVAAYRGAFPQRQFSFETACATLLFNGAPDLIVQMLDKLIDNAVDFSPAGTTIVVRLQEQPHAAVIDVDNAGALLPPEIAGQLFESLWQSRPEPDASNRPHFGLGLYIVRLIAQFHGGEATAANLPDASGVRFTARLAR
jgi:two-component system, OmpR family, sensor histidine kinase ChvG